LKNKNLLRKSVIKLTCSALLAATCVILATVAKGIFGTSPLRITIENLPIFIASFFFGPLWGMIVAVCADLLSCLNAGMAPYPLIAIGAAVIGGVSGTLYKYVLKNAKNKLRIVLSVLISHALGSMTIKTMALGIMMADAGIMLVLRIPVYIAIAIIESIILIYLTNNKAFMNQINIITGEK
jgi:ECF transporter S component (folate family)